MAICLSCALASCSSDDSLKLSDFITYRNPVARMNIPDPTVIKVDTNWFVFSSGSEDYQIRSFFSQNLTEWTEIDPVFSEDNTPDFITDATLQSPEIVSLNGNYLLYYTLKNDSISGIGVASSSSINGPWTDNGSVITNEETSLSNIENPSFIQDNGANYLAFGSFGGIYLAKLSSDGLSLDPASEITLLANEIFDAPTIIKYGNYYYLILTVDVATGGASCPCILTVGRASSIAGPYQNKNGESMLDGNYETLIESNTKFRGPGHNSQLITDNEGSSWILYNSYDLTDVSLGRTLMLDPITWEDDWPSVRGAVSSFCTNIPRI